MEELVERRRICKPDLTGKGQHPVAGFCEQGYGYSGCASAQNFFTE
jgi:hypothetical protein